MAVRPKSYQKATSERGGKTQMQLAKRDIAFRQWMAMHVATVLDAAARGWVSLDSVLPKNISDLTFQQMKREVLKAAKNSGQWFDWQDEKTDLRIIRIDALAREYLEQARNAVVSLPAPEPSLNRDVSYIARQKWIALVQAIKAAARLDSQRFYWNKSDLRQDNVFRISGKLKAA